MWLAWWFGLALLAAAREVRFVWLSDIHLDVEYNAVSGQRTYCRANTTLQEINRTCDSLAELMNVNLSAWSGAGDEEETIPSPPSNLQDDLSVPLLPAYHGRFGCDAPPSLVWATLLAIRDRISTTPADFLLVTGDFAGHYWSDRRCLRSLTLIAATTLIKEAFKPSAQTCIPKSFDDQRDVLHTVIDRCRLSGPSVMPQPIFCVGNNDLKRDYIPEENSDWNRELYELWGGWVVPSDQKAVFTRGLYYAVPLRNSTARTRVLCLNTMWWSRTGPAARESHDPAGQYAWLKQQLVLARSRNENVLIAGHIPPSHALYRLANAGGGFAVDRQWHDYHNKRYHHLVWAFRDVVKGQYFGHFHTDDIRFQTHRRKGDNGVDPSGVVFVAPGICPNHGNNPSWRLATAETDPHWVLKEYEQEYVPLYGDDHQLASFNRMLLPRFQLEYMSKDRFVGAEDLSVRELFDHYWSTLTTEGYQKYWNAQVAMGDFPPSFLMKCIIEEDWIIESVRRCVNRYVNETAVVVVTQ